MRSCNSLCWKGTNFAVKVFVDDIVSPPSSLVGEGSGVRHLRGSCVRPLSGWSNTQWVSESTSSSSLSSESQAIDVSMGDTCAHACGDGERTRAQAVSKEAVTWPRGVETPSSFWWKGTNFAVKVFVDDIVSPPSSLVGEGSGVRHLRGSCVRPLSGWSNTQWVSESVSSSSLSSDSQAIVDSMGNPCGDGVRLRALAASKGAVTWPRGVETPSSASAAPAAAVAATARPLPTAVLLRCFQGVASLARSPTAAGSGNGRQVSSRPRHRTTSMAAEKPPEARAGKAAAALSVRGRGRGDGEARGACAKATANARA
mmetsp:Transcript_66295/g.190548  ORF Transcript_66295/g.190548 Transcript_66295/m.190548 type:complete len:314 (-) Transcript_66295:6-947(-)